MARRKPGPKPKVPRLVEGRDYFCGTCVGRKRVPCPCCYGGCAYCDGDGTLPCEQCRGGEVPVPPPEWL